LVLASISCGIDIEIKPFVMCISFPKRMCN
jgi:hypothetical protein